MVPRRTPAPYRLASRSWALIALLATSGALVVALAFHAARTARRQQTVAAQVLRDHAASAAWQFANAYATAVNAELIPALLPAVGLPPLGSELGLPGIEVLRQTARSALRCSQPSEDTARYYFRVDFRDRTVLTDRPEVRGLLDPSLVDTVIRYARRADRGGMVLKGIRRVGEGRRLLAYGVRYDQKGAPFAAYGFETCISSLTALFPQVLAHDPLIPPFLTGNAPSDSLLTLTVLRTASADTLFVSQVRYPNEYSATTPSVGVLGLSFRVTLRPDIAPKLIIGGMPESRLPLLFALLALTTGVMVVAYLQLRKESALARLRSDFVASVSHELRTPLSQILLFADSLRLGRARSADQQSLAIDVISQEARRLIHLVENVLHLSRAERGSPPLARVTAPLAPMVRDVVASYAPLASSRDVAFRVYVDEQLTVQTDPDAFRQIMLNLLDNAVKFGPMGQEVLVRAWADGNAVAIAVEDEGVGIPPSHCREIWKPFVRVNGDVNDAPGSGIGLAVVKDLAERLGGRVRYEARTEKGSRFVVELSRATPPSAGSGVAQ